MKVKNIFFGFLTLFTAVNFFAQETKKPNILFIAIDDLKPTIGAFDDSFAITPNLDAFSENATVFLNNHCQWAVCGPSRASLMTGKRPDATKVRDLKTRMRDVNPDILALPEYFKQNGYTTVGVGKIYDPRCVDKYRDEPSWSEPFITEGKLKYPAEYGAPALGYYQNKEIKAKIATLIQEGKDKGVKNSQKYARDRYKPPYETSNAPDAAYTDGAIALRGLELLEEVSKDPSKPFFLAVGFKRPHLPFVAPQKYWDLYDESKIPYAPYQHKAKNGKDIGYHTSNELQSYKDPDNIEYVMSDENLLNLDKETQKKLIHGYYAATSFVDVQVGKVLDKLKEKGLDKNTIVIIWGDHGWHLGDHSLWNKHSNFEQATRSPMMILMPGSKKSIRVNSPTEFVDVFPTLCELAGLEVPENLDGLSLASIVEGKTDEVKKYAVSQISRGKNMGYSFRSDQYRYTVWIKNKFSTDKISSKDITAQELYDYKNDPLETVDHFGESRYKMAQNEMIKYSEEYFKSEHEKTKKKTSKSSGVNKSIKQLLKDAKVEDKFYIGATLNHRQLGSSIEKLFLKDFTYSTPENCAKQKWIHPKPNVWNWSKIDDYLDFAKKNNISIRLHGPISPQASEWAKTDSRTAKELEKNMTEFMTALSMRYNNHKNVKWMDVVNETIERNGAWFKDKPGVSEWENPWVKMGYDDAGVPLYISKAFELANQYAPNISQVYNQHGSMEPVMWEKVKETILYLKAKGYRIDGLGWQAHVKSTETLMLDGDESLQYFSELIDWAHANDLDFHVTEFDYKIMDSNNTPEMIAQQAEAYANIIKVLWSKKESGLVTFNTWGMVDGKGKSADRYRFMYDSKSQPKSAYFALKKSVNDNL